MSPDSESDGHDPPGLVQERVPGETAMVEDVSVGCEDAIGEPVVSHELPYVLNRVEFGRPRRQGHQGNVVGHRQLGSRMPTGLVQQQHGMGAWSHGSRDLGQVQFHGLCRAAGKHEAGCLALCRANGTEDVCRAGALVLRRDRSRAAPGPATGELVFLANAGFVLKPDLYWLSACMTRRDRRQLRCKVFLKSGIASTACA